MSAAFEIDTRRAWKDEHTQLALEVRQHGVGVSGRDGDGDPGQDAQEKDPRLGAHEGGNDRAVEGSDIEGEGGASDEEKGVQEEERGLL